MNQATILLADDEDTLRENLARVLSEEGFEVTPCATGSRALEVFESTSVDAIITDLRMPGLTGLELIHRVRESSLGLPIIVITAFGDVATAVDAMKQGANDFICKPLIFDELVIKLRQALTSRDLAKENKLLRQQIHRRFKPSGVIAEAHSMREILDTIQQVSHTMSNVLFLGESGTGKEAMTRTLHFAGVTKDKAFVAVNCGGLTESLIESELFGYRRGAFTGATSDHIGYFEAASGGTLFLDEIGALPLASQAVLLRAIEDKTITRVGDTRPRRVDLRIVAATNIDLEEAVAKGTFREDLFYRLDIVRMVLPPLRERIEDIPALVKHFVSKFNIELQADCPGFSVAAMLAVSAHSWPGNVRELENVVERALIFARGRPVELTDLPRPIRNEPVQAHMPLDLKSATREFEKRHVIEILSHHGNNKHEAAKALGIGLSSLYRKIEEMGLGKHSNPSQP
jgi:DNA-binding NtrC family response regulator